MAGLGHSGFSHSESPVGAITGGSPIGKVYKSSAGGTDNLNLNYNDIEGLRASAANTAMITTYSIPLSMFKHSVLLLPQDLYLGGLKLTITVNFSAINDYCFIAGDANFNNATALTSPTPGGVGSVSLSGLQLRLAVEDNNEIAQLLVQKVASSGLKLAIPSIVESKWSTDASNYSSNVVHLNVSRGQKLLRCYSTQMTHNGTPTARLCTFWNNNNTLNALWTSCRDSINNRYLQDSALANYDAYKFMKDSLSDTCIQNYNQWATSACVYMQDFSGYKSAELSGRENNDAGLSLLQPIDYTVEFSKATQAQFFFVWCITQKVLDIKAGSVNVSVM